jgi:DNA-binding CsgD family transcriptional regulator
MRAWGLTHRERDVARLVIDGLSTEDIATALFVSVHTVNSHLKMLFGKVGVSRRQELVAALTGGTPPRPMSPRNRSEAPSPATASPSPGTPARPGFPAGSGDTDALGGRRAPGAAS